ncbi:kinase-like domain-containing protein [Amanita rubescens]|nr:kinase-like domain-containing protein [Amanita rubescens]
MLNILTHFASKSNPGPDAVDIVRRARRFILEIVVSKMWMGIPLSDDPYLTQSAGAFPFLLFLLDHFQKLGSEASVVPNPVTINLMNEILSRNDYIDFAILINKASRAKRLLDLLLEMLRHHSLSHLDPSTAWRARRFMLKVVSKTPVIPPSLIVTGIKIPAERDYVGDGCFGQVFKGNLHGAVVALKVLHEPYDKAAFCREGLMWRSLKHKFLLPLLGIHEIEDPKAPQFFLVSPYMKNGTLSRWLMEADPPVTQIEERILEVAQGMEYIHSEGAVHGDIHGGNILLDDDLHAQIADFGLTLLSGGRSRTLVHPNRAISPVLSEQSDVYAFGSLCQDIQFENMMPLSPGKSDLEILNLISQGALPHAWDVIQRCLADEPLERPTMRDVVESMMSISRYGSPGSSIYPETPRASLSPTPVLQCAG